MANLWLEALASCGTTEIEAGFEAWFEREKYFPKPAQIAEAGRAELERRARWERQKNQRIALPAMTGRSEEQLAHFKAKCRGLVNMVRSPAQPRRDFRDADADRAI